MGETELREVLDGATPQFEQLRRLSLLEGVQGEQLELIVLLDRASCLLEAGLSVQIFCAFAAIASDRNLAILAEPSPSSSSALLDTSDLHFAQPDH